MQSALDSAIGLPRRSTSALRMLGFLMRELNLQPDDVYEMQAEPDYLTKNRIRIIDSANNELQPQQIISLMGLGGASFPLADHHDHIHVGF